MKSYSAVLPCGNLSLCTGCTACASICPHNAITMQEDKEGFQFPILDQELCISCSLCEQVCPVIHPSKHSAADTVWAAWSCQEDDLTRSASGGLASALARAVLAEGGAAVGAVMTNFYVHHDIIDGIEDLPALQGSKYVQSDMGDCFQKNKGSFRYRS